MSPAANPGAHHAHTLCGVAQMPCDYQLRPRCDPIAPGAREPVLLAVCEGLDHRGVLANLRSLQGQRLVALYGTTSCASQAMHGPHGLTRHLSHSPTRSSHAALNPVGVGPGRSQVIALPPESIMPQDGQTTQDGERAAGTRGLATHAKPVAPQGVTVLGAELSSHQPLWT